MKSKKGFTLVELLGVILLLAILLVVAVPSIMRYMKKGTKNYYHSLESEMKVSGVDYMETYRTLLPKNIGHVTVVELQELIDNKYIDPVKDEKGNLCEGQVTVKKVKTNSYEYHSCLKCGEYYESEEQECNYSELENEYEDSGDYRIETDQDYYIVNQLEEFVSPLARVYYKEQLIKEDLVGHPKRVDTSRIGVFEVIYYYHGVTKKIQVEVVDVTAPGQTKVTMKYNNKNGKNYKGNWYSGNIYVQYKASDYTDKGIAGIGIDYYEVSDDGSNFHRMEADNQSNYEKLSKSEHLMKREGNYVRYVRAVDKAGNIGPVKSYTIKIDKTNPTCEWYNENRTWRTGSLTITSKCFDSITECDDTVSPYLKNYSITISNTTKTRYLSYQIQDLAGNKVTCGKTVDVYIDNTPPSCTYSGESTEWQNTPRTISWGCSDGSNQSGCSRTNIGSQTFSSTMKTHNVSFSIRDNVGNSRSCSKTMNVYVDTTPPSSSITVTSTASNYNTKDATVEVSGSDADSGIEYACISESSSCSWASSSGSYSKTHSMASDYDGSSKTLYGYMKDKAGNISSVSSATYKVYKYCTEKSIGSYSKYGGCSNSCGSGTKKRTADYIDKYITTHSCGTSAKGECYADGVSGTNECKASCTGSSGCSSGDEGGGGGGGGEGCPNPHTCDPWNPCADGTCCCQYFGYTCC